MKIAIYRMFFHKEFVKALQKTSNQITFFSSERRLDDSGVIDRYYRTGDEAVLPSYLINDIIIRCRYLSGINLLEARNKVRKMWASVEWYFDNNHLDLILTPAVDNYVTDIWYRLASDRSIPAFQPRASSLPDLVRITNSVDNHTIRDPSEADVDTAIAFLRDNFKAGYQNVRIRSPLQVLQRAMKEVIKKVIFEYWKIQYSDPDSFHYNAIFPNKNTITIKSVSQIWFHKKFKGSISDIKRKSQQFQKVVFWPLAMTPESALCYLNSDSNFSDYRDVIAQVVDSIPEDTLLVVKEHPSAIGYRSVEQYDRLIKSENVIICNPSEQTGRIIRNSDAILINTSSTTGLEAVAIGKPVLALGNCNYASKGIVEEINCVENISNWGQKLRTQPLNDREIKTVVKKYLSNTLDGATWAQKGIGQPDYSNRIHRTIETCIDVVRSGYIPRYHGRS